MRKIEQAMCLAAGQNRTWKSGNTAVVPIDDVNAAVYLHGNEIACVNSNTGFVMVNMATLAKWPTRTTKSRLRALGARV
jgi:hypothetical protein